MQKGPLAIDPRGLIYEAYRMDVTPEDCRAILFDWALGLPGPAGRAEIEALLAHYGAAHPDHPMTDVLRGGLAAVPTPARRGRLRPTSPPR